MPDGPDSYRVAVRTLTEFVCRRGDIHFRYDAATLGKEGIDAQRRLQQRRGDDYQREVKLEHACVADGFAVTVGGRADGVDRSTAVPAVEEFKATRAEVEPLHEALGHLHFAQARCYAAMLALAEPATPAWALRLVYVHPRTLATVTFEQREPREALIAFLDATCAVYVEWLAAERLHRSCRDSGLRAVAFPHAAFRPHQRELAAAVYRSARDAQALLAEAPTGCGKTLATVFPALKAIGEGHQDRVVYLTSRTTGQRAAELAFGQVNAAARFRQVTITAKQRICFMPEPVCDPALCRYARGYYDRRTPALKALLDGAVMDRARIEDVAKAHAVCPFELSLDAASWADAVVGDYNYVFDPIVRLNRIRGTLGDRALLLIDEAHQLADRARAMLSTRFERRLLRRALALELPAAVRRSVQGLDRRFATLRREAQRAHGFTDRTFECTVEAPERFVRAGIALTELLRDQHDALPDDPALTELAFALFGLARALDWYDPQKFATVVTSAGREITLEIVCLDPSTHIAAELSAYGASVRFSATVSPAALFQRLHGTDEAPALQLPSPFPADHLDVSVVPDLSVLYRDRDRTLEQLIDLVHTVVSARSGNYLVALPSFAYLERTAAAYIARFGASGVRIQRTDMDAAEREAFLADFASGAAPVTGFVVMGGVFTESVDLPGEALIGVVVVGTALAPRSLERDRIADAYGGSLGFTVAYQQPAMTRVVQTAGRLIRSPSDRGVLVLVDRRFLDADYQRFLPPAWRPSVVRRAELGRRLERFWRPASDEPSGPEGKSGNMRAPVSG